MIMALMADLLMRLRCFLLRRGEAGRNGARRAAGDKGATVERAERQPGEGRGHGEYKGRRHTFCSDLPTQFTTFLNMTEDLRI